MPRILIVDDDPDILETLVFAFEQDGFDVQSANDGRTALVRAERQPPDLMLLDVMLPGLNGYEVSRLLKAAMVAGRLTPFRILMLTARRVSRPLRQDLLASWSAADATLWKPYDLGHLRLLARQLLGAPPRLPPARSARSDRGSSITAQNAEG